jgi:hypothetical protein
MAMLLAERRHALEQQLLELEPPHSGTALETRYLNETMANVLAKLAADSAALSDDEQAQIQRALALTERGEPARATVAGSGA